MRSPTSKRRPLSGGCGVDAALFDVSEEGEHAHLGTAHLAAACLEKRDEIVIRELGEHVHASFATRIFSTPALPRRRAFDASIEGKAGDAANAIQRVNAYEGDRPSCAMRLAIRDASTNASTVKSLRALVRVPMARRASAGGSAPRHAHGKWRVTPLVSGRSPSSPHRPQYFTKTWPFIGEPRVPT